LCASYLSRISSGPRKRGKFHESPGIEKLFSESSHKSCLLTFSKHYINMIIKFCTWSSAWSDRLLNSGNMKYSETSIYTTTLALRPLKPPNRKPICLSCVGDILCEKKSYSSPPFPF
jgi:hypothetical protein